MLGNEVAVEVVLDTLIGREESGDDIPAEVDVDRLEKRRAPLTVGSPTVLPAPPLG